MRNLYKNISGHLVILLAGRTFTWRPTNVQICTGQDNLPNNYKPQPEECQTMCLLADLWFLLEVYLYVCLRLRHREPQSNTGTKKKKAGRDRDTYVGRKRVKMCLVGKSEGKQVQKALRRWC